MLLLRAPRLQAAHPRKTANQLQRPACPCCPLLPTLGSSFTRGLFLMNLAREA